MKEGWYLDGRDSTAEEVAAWAAAQAGRKASAYGHAAEALARAQAADEGAAAALAGLPITACPYTGEWVKDARRRSWERAWIKSPPARERS